MTRHSRFIALALGLLCLFHSSFAYALNFDVRKKSPLTTKGDLYTFDTANNRLAVSADNSFLAADSGTSTGLAWKAISASGTVSNSGTLTSNAVIIGGGTTVVSAITADTATTGHFLASTATSPAFRQIVSSDIVGTQSVAGGGTGITTGNSGGIPYFANAGLMASSSAFTANAVVLGGGAGTAPSTITADTATTHALFSTATAPAFRQINTSDVVGTLAAINGGTGQTTFTKGDILVSPASNVLNKLGVGSMGQILSVDTAATTGVKWVTGIVSSDVQSGVFPESKGGTGQATYTQGDILVASGSNVLTKLAIGSMGQMLSVDSGTTTKLKWVTAPSGGAGTPGTPVGSIQFNSASTFGGAALVSTDTAGLVVRIGPGTSTIVSLDVAGNFRTVPFSLTDGATISIDPTKSNVFTVTLAGAPRKLMNPQTQLMVPFQRFIVAISQDATGSRKIGFDTMYKFGADVPSFDASTTATTTDYVAFVVRNAQSIDVVGVSRGYR